MRGLLIASLILLAPAAASAQAEMSAAAPIEDRPEIKLNEVERGFFVMAEAGGIFLFNPAGSGAGFSPGRNIALTLGTDIGERISLGLLVMGTNHDTPAGYVAPSGRRGDFSSFALGAVGKFAFWARPDANGVNRTFLYARAGAAMGLMGPKAFFEGPDILAIGGLGFEVFTNLRHFSVGIEADGLYGVRNMGPGFMLQPHVRYTF